MPSLTISVPEELRAVIDEEVAVGRYPTVSAYVQDLIRRQHAKAHLERLLMSGLASGIDPRTPAELFADLRNRPSCR